MIIKKIHLENYRSHNEKTIEFSEGINLILGKNGSGKSSILEAISSTLFGVVDRTGKTTGKEFIKYGSSSAKIEIEFIGVDDRAYSITNIFHKKKPKQEILKDLTSEEEFKMNVAEKLEEICGLKKDYKKIYENIIVAKQNEFINVFKEKPEDRAKIFNEIFNTDIYTKMSSNLFEIEKKYETECKDLEKEKNLISANMPDEEDIKNLLEIEKKNLKNILNEKNYLEKEKIKIKNQIENYNRDKNNLENLKNVLNENISKIKKNKTELKSSILITKKAKKAKILVNENKSAFYEYQSLNEKFSISQQKERNLQKIKDNNIKLSNENENLKIRIENLEKETVNLEQERDRLRENWKKYDNEIRILEEKIADDKRNILSYKKIVDELQNLENKKNVFEKEENSLISKIETTEKTILDKQEILSKIDIISINYKLENIENLKINIINLRNDITRLEKDIELFTLAGDNFKSKTCPFLRESCENIKNRNVDNFFDENIIIFKNEIKEMIKEIKNSEDIIIQEANLSKKKNEYTFLVDEIKNMEYEKINLELSLKDKKLNKDKNDLDIKQILLENNFESSEKLRQEIKLLELALSNKILEIEKIKNSQNDVHKEGTKLRDEIIKNNKDLENYSKKIEENNKNINLEANLELSELIEKNETLKENLAKLQNSYSIYLENIKISDMLDNNIEKINFLIEDIFNLRAKKNNSVLEIKNLEKKLENFLIEELNEKLSSIEKNLDTFSKSIGTLEAIIKNHLENLNLIEKHKDKIKKLSSNLKRIEVKKEKTKFLKENVKKMAIEVAKNMLLNISEVASINFNKITGRSEKIYWSNDSIEDKKKGDKYQIYLVNNEKKIPFEHLSGGEQVSIAIAVRGAMTQYFSNAKFMILDEPTNNLDIEKKKLLAEYIGEILDILDQSIIVTHDDTFREMAEQIIEL